MYYFLEIIRDSMTHNLVGATLIYNSNGRTVKYTTTNERELENILYNYERQKGMNRSALMYYGHIAETTNEKIRNGQYEGRDMLGYHFPNLSAFERIRRTEKYGTNVNWVDRMPEKKHREKLIELPNIGNIRIKPLLLSLLVAGSIGIGANGISKIKDYNSLYNEHVNTIKYNDFDLYLNYGKFDDIFTKLANGNYYEVHQDELSEIINKINELYQQNMAGSRNEVVEGRPKFSGGCYSFASYFNEKTDDNFVLKYVEDKYNSIVSSYAYTLDLKSSGRYTSQRLDDLCDELYSFIYKNGYINNMNFRYNELSPLARLIINEIFDNCAKSIKYTVDESHLKYSRQKGYQRLMSEQVISLNEAERNKIIVDLYDRIGINIKSSK